MNRKPKVHVLEDIHAEAMSALEEHAEVMTADEPFPSKCDAVIVRARRVMADEMRASSTLKVIGKHGAGTDNIDLEAARHHGIRVVSTPGANAESVADLAVGFALALIRRIHQNTLALQSGEPYDASLSTGFEISELSVGIAGLGAIGQAVARRLNRGFGCSVSGYDPGLAPNAWPDQVGRHASLDELVAVSNLVFVHMPLLETTRNVFDERLIGTFPPGSFLVNCSRGGIVDEDALAAALFSGHLAGAASDVFATEPPACDNPLLLTPNFLATPHIGASTNAGLRRVGLTVVASVLRELGATGDEQATDRKTKGRS